MVKIGEVGSVSMHGKEVLRNCKCWRCKHRGEYEWRTPRGANEKIPNSKKLYCTKTKRWGSLKRAYYCKHFESDSYKGP